MYRDDKSIIEDLRTNLDERYRFDGGRTLLRELVQNADDAGAARVRFSALPGWSDSEADHPLLKVPGLLIANDGHFDAASSAGMSRFGGSVKATDTSAIGRFGMGQKTAFHVCDAFLVVSSGYDPEVPSLLVNPYIVIGKPGDDCLDWQATPTEKDRSLLLTAGLDSAPKQMVQWYPLRNPSLKPKKTTHGFLPKYYDETLLEEARDAFWLSGIVTLLRNVQTLEVMGAKGQSTIIDRNEAQRLRFDPERPGIHAFGGPLGSSIKSAGREIMEAKGYTTELIASDSWPDILDRENDTMVKQKALPHGAVAVLADPEGADQLDVTWSVFLPVTRLEAPRPTSAGRVEIFLHGYFFVNSGRDNILGFDEQARDGGRDVSVEWNSRLRDELVLPLLPQALYDALQDGVLTETGLGAVVSSLNRLALTSCHRNPISSKNILARTLRKGSIGWNLNPPVLQLRPLPAPATTRLPPIMELIPNLEERMSDWGFVPTVGADAVLAPVSAEWHEDELARLAELLTPAAYAQGGKLAHFADFLQFTRKDPFATSPSLIAPVLGKLRQAMCQRDIVMAEGTHIRAVLRHLPPDCVLSMPPSVMRSTRLRRTLAMVSDARLCVHRDWCVEGDSRQSLPLEEAKALLKALQPLFSDTATEEAAATAAMAILRALGTNLSAAHDDAEFRKLQIVRVDKGQGFVTSASLDELTKAAEGRKLFALNNENRDLVSLLEAAAPGAGAMVVNYSEAAQLLSELGSGLSYARDPRFETARLAAASDLPGPDEARLELLLRLWSNDGRYRPFLRAILAGRPEARFDNRDLLWIQGGNSHLDAFARRIIEADSNAILLSSSLLTQLPEARQEMLGIRRFNGAALGEKLVANSRRVATEPMSPELFEALFTAGIPEEHLEQLPIFDTALGRMAAKDGYRRNADLPFPEAIEAQVPILKGPTGTAAREQFMRLTSKRLWTAERQMHFLLELPDPRPHAQHIISALHDGMAEDIVAKLSQKDWLTLQDGRAICPSGILELPGVPRDILPAGTATLDDLQPKLLPERAIRSLCRAGILKDRTESRDALIARLANDGTLCWIGDRPGEVAEQLQTLARGKAALGLPGWPLLAWLLDNDATSAADILRRTQNQSQPSSTAFNSWMNGLAELASGGSSEARALYGHSFRLLARLGSQKVSEILSGTKVPTQAGTWQHAAKVVSHGGAVAFSHRLEAKLSNLLPLPSQFHSQHASHQGASEPPNELNEQQSADSLRPILRRAQVAVPAEMLAVIVVMLGQSDFWLSVLGKELGLTRDVIDGLVNDFATQVGAAYRPGHDRSLHERSARTRILFRQRDAADGVDEFQTLAGTHETLPLGDAEPLDIVGTINRPWRTLQNGTMLRVLDVILPDAASLTEYHVTAFGQTLAEHYIGSRAEQIEARQAFDSLLAGRAQFAEHVAKAVQAEIRDQLPKILGELKPVPGRVLASARDAYDRQVLRAGATIEEKRAALKDALWSNINQPAAHAEMLERVRERITEHGYSPARVFFELYQNADDAWQQDPAWPTAPGRFEIERGKAKIIIRHWGRLINVASHGGQEGDRVWNRDLYHMLVLNLSDKDRAEAVTGRFGLGFKSVHLLADHVRIASRHVACHVKGGLLPDPWDEGKTRSFEAQRLGRPATIIEFDHNEGSLLEQAWSSFRKSVRWLPAMGRGVRDIEVVRDLRRERFGADFANTAIDGIRLLSMTGSEPGKALALDLDEDTTLFLPLGPNGPTAPAEGTPGLWLLAPLDVDARPHWLMNSRAFRVDPGRGHLSGTLDDRRAVFRQHGKALARRLIALSDMFAADWVAFARQAGLEVLDPADGPRLFWSALAKSFALDLDDEMLQALHIDTRVPRDGSGQAQDAARSGWAQLICERAVFPTKLDTPFAPLLRASDVRWHLKGIMAMNGVASELGERIEASRILKRSVADKAAHTLERIGLTKPSTLHGGAFLAEVLRDSRKIDPALAAWLGKILSPERLEKVERSERDSILEQLRSAQFQMVNQEWNTAGLMPQNIDRAKEDERLIADFASSDDILSDIYKGPALDLYELARGSGRYGSLLAPAKLAEFARKCTKREQKQAVLYYILHGERGAKLAKELGSNRGLWLPRSFEELCASDFAQAHDRADLQRHVLPHLYPREHENIIAGRLNNPVILPPSPSSPERPAPEIVLERLHQWWNRKHLPLSGSYTRETYGEGMRPKLLRNKVFEDDPEGWFTFFAQGVFHTIQWGNATASRNFIERARSAGWWGEMARISQAHSYKPWTDRLDELAKQDGSAEDFRRWRRALGELYVVALWLPDYVDVFNALPGFVKRDGSISLADHWWPSASQAHQRRGTEGASLIRALGTGANWMIREAVRDKVWGDDSAYMHGYGWANSAAMRRFAREIGWTHLDETGGMDASRDIHKTFFDVLSDRASFGGALDLPVQLLMTQKNASDWGTIFGSGVASLGNEEDTLE